MFKAYTIRAFFPPMSPDSASGGGDTTSSTETVALSQGLEVVSDADLGGPEESSTETETDDKSETADKSETDAKSDDATDEKTDTPSEPDTDKSTGDDSEDDTDKDTQTETDKSEDESDKSEPSKPKSDNPPKGMVPLAAVKEARDENRYLKSRLAELTTRLDNIDKVKPVETEETVEDTFEVLSTKDFKSLSEDDPSAALLYMQELNMYQQKQAKTESDKKDAASEAKDAKVNREQYDNIIQGSLDAMERVVPGIFEEGSEAHEQLTTFAEEIGFDSDMFYLTNPETQIILPGESEPLLLGDQAATMLQMLTNSQKLVADAKTSVDESAIETRIRKEVTAELTAKFKKSTGKDFKSLTSVPKAEGGQEFGTKVLSDTQFAKLSDVEQEAYLAGA